MASLTLIIIIQLLIAVLLQQLEIAAMISSETLHTDNVTKLPLDKLRQVFSLSRLKSKDYKF